MSAMQRRKGNHGERELHKLISDELGFVVQRRLLAAREGGCDGLDVPGWAIEVKRTEVLTLPAFWGQATRQAREEKRKPVLFWRKSRAPWLAYVDPHDVNPDLFGPDRHPIAMPLPLWCEMARGMM